MDNFQHLTASTLDRNMHKRRQARQIEPGQNPGHTQTLKVCLPGRDACSLLYLMLCYKPGLGFFNGCSVSRQVIHDAFLSDNWCHS